MQEQLPCHGARSNSYRPRHGVHPHTGTQWYPGQRARVRVLGDRWEWRDDTGQPLGWGRVDDEESVRAIHRALDPGVTFFDTTDTPGTAR